ncbi:hypothetical protein ABN226_18445, partial [Morganella morganii]|uniref:hypothetical protein n=1 Tax=Morganella morganii TaxID=582 RepID=UPI0032DB0D67
MKFIIGKVSGTDEINLDTLKILHAIWNNNNMDWAQIIFDSLLQHVQSSVSSANQLISKKVGFGFVVQHLLHLKGLELREGREIHRNTYMGRTKSQAPKGKSAKDAPSPSKPRAKGKRKAQPESVNSDDEPLGNLIKRVQLPKRAKRAKKIYVSQIREVAPVTIQVPFEDRAQAQGESQATLAAEIERVPPTRSLSGTLCVDLLVNDGAEGAGESEDGPREEVREVEGTGISDPVQAETEEPREVVREIEFPAASARLSVQEAAEDQGTVVRDPVQSAENVTLTPMESARIERTIAQASADIGIIGDLSDGHREISRQAVGCASPTEIVSTGSDRSDVEVSSRMNQVADDVLTLDDFSRVLRWIEWRTGPIDQLILRAGSMMAEEDFALNWLNLTEIPATELLNIAHETNVTKKNLGRTDKGKGIADDAQEEEAESELDPTAEAQYREEIRLATALSLGHQVEVTRGPGETSGIAKDSAENPIATAAIPLSQVADSALGSQTHASRGEFETSEAREVAQTLDQSPPPHESTPSTDEDEAQTVREGEIPLLQLPGFPIDMERPSPFLLPTDDITTFAARMVDRERWSAPVAPELIEISDSSEQTDVQNEQQEQNDTSPAGSRSAEEFDVDIEGGNREAPIDPSSPNPPADDQVTSTGSRGEAEGEVPLDGNREASNTEVPSLAEPIQSVAEAEAPGSRGDEREVIHPSGGNREAPDMELPSSSDPSAPAEPQRQVREVDSQMQVMGGNLEAPKSPPMTGNPDSPSSTSDFGSQAEKVFIGEVRQFMADQTQRMAQLEHILAVVRNHAMPVAGTSTSQARHEELLEQTVWAEDAARKAADDAAVARSEAEKTRDELAELRAEFTAYQNSSELRQDEMRAMLEHLSNQVPAQLESLFEGVTTLLSRDADANKGEDLRGITGGRGRGRKRARSSEPARSSMKRTKLTSWQMEEAARIQRSLEMEKRRQEDEERKKKRQEQQTAKEKKDEQLIRGHRMGIKEDTTEYLQEIIVSLLAKTDLSLHSGLTARECIEWWRDGVIEGNF